MTNQMMRLAKHNAKAVGTLASFDVMPECRAAHAMPHHSSCCPVLKPMPLHAFNHASCCSGTYGYAVKFGSIMPLSEGAPQVCHCVAGNMLLSCWQNLMLPAGLQQVMAAPSCAAFAQCCKTACSPVELFVWPGTVVTQLQAACDGSSN